VDVCGENEAMAGSPIDIVIFAPLAPILGVLLFWFIQLLFIESQKYFLAQLNKNHEPFCRFTNFIGIFFQTICHALGYTVTKHGISDFYISVHYGKVAPKKEKTGVFKWLSNGFLFLGPFFVPPFLLYCCLFFLMNEGFLIITPLEFLEIKYTFAGQLSTFGASLYSFSIQFFLFLGNIDLMHPAHFGFFLLFILLGLGIRPSYIGEKTLKKVDIFYDLKNIRYKLLHKPLYIILFFLSAYIFFYISVLFDLNWYVSLFSIFGIFSIIAITSLLFAHGLIFFIKLTDRIPGFYRIISLLLFPISYVSFRIIFFIIPITNIPLISLGLSILLTSGIVVFFLHQLTNTFKSRKMMKSRNKNK